MGASWILERLRDETRPLHVRAERAVDLPARLASRESYIGFLARMLGFHAPLEAQLARVHGLDAVVPDLPSRRKAPLLKGDLAACGLSAAAIAAMPECPVLPAMPALPQALGVLYVLEGSTLGGQFIRKEVSRRLGLGPGTGCAFFAGYGDQTGPLWRAFCISLTDFTQAHPGMGDAIVSTAAETFERFEAWLGEGP